MVVIKISLPDDQTCKPTGFQKYIGMLLQGHQCRVLESASNLRKAPCIEQWFQVLEPDAFGNWPSFAGVFQLLFEMHLLVKSENLNHRFSDILSRKVWREVSLSLGSLDVPCESKHPGNDSEQSVV